MNTHPAKYGEPRGIFDSSRPAADELADLKLIQQATRRALDRCPICGGNDLSCTWGLGDAPKDVWR